jgi:hypothetical protein
MPGYSNSFDGYVFLQAELLGQVMCILRLFFSFFW